MLSRVAESLYWMSRYLERAEHTARVVDLNLNLMLDQAPDPGDQRWQRLLKGLMVTLDPESRHDAYNVAQTMTFDPSNRVSIVGCMTAARENARQVREQISSEMWEELNQLFLQIKRAGVENTWQAQPHHFFRGVKDGAHLFQGITDSTLSHSEGWHFIQLGRFLERAGATAALLDAYVGEFAPPTQLAASGQNRLRQRADPPAYGPPAYAGGPDSSVTSGDGEVTDANHKGDYLEMVGLLKSCTAFEAYCKVYTADLTPERIAEFLLLNSEFPRSVRFAAEMIQSALNAIAETSSTRKTGRANRLAGRLRASLSFSQIDEIMGSGLHVYLADIQRQCAQIHTAIYQQYVSYPIESALAS
jgi:uncharacterized alpha-E superfamily protein